MKNVGEEKLSLRRVLSSRSPLAQLLPGLHQFLNCSGRRKIPARNSAFAIGPFIKFANPLRTQQSEIAGDLLQLLAAPDLLFTEFRSPCHGNSQLTTIRFLFATRRQYSQTTLSLPFVPSPSRPTLESTGIA